MPLKRAEPFMSSTVIEDENEKENIINLENKSYLSDNSSLKQGINLEDLLDNDNHEENENQSIKKKNDIKSNYNKSLNKYNEYDMDVDNNHDLFILCPIKKNDKNKKGSNNIKTYKSPISHSSQSSIPISITKKRNTQSVYTGKIKKNSNNKKYYKIFFFLLLKSIILNNNILEHFQKNDFETLFEECQKEEVPFNQYQEWIINKIYLNDNCKNNTYVDSSIIDCFICSSII